jgi:hypothetical protein
MRRRRTIGTEVTAKKLVPGVAVASEVEQQAQPEMGLSSCCDGLTSYYPLQIVGFRKLWLAAQAKILASYFCSLTGLSQLLRSKCLFLLFTRKIYLKTLIEMCMDIYGV